MCILMVVSSPTKCVHFPFLWLFSVQQVSHHEEAVKHRFWKILTTMYAVDKSKSDDDSDIALGEDDESPSESR